MAAAWCLLVLSLLIVVTTPLPGSCEDTGSSLLIQCYEPAVTITNGTAAFRASLRRLLGALPSAAAPTGFASLRSTSTGASAFARGLCFGNSSTVPPSECRRCLSVAARSLASGCGATTRRAGVWSDRCFLAYADTSASSPRENAFRSRLLLRGDTVPVSDADAVAAYHSGYYYSHTRRVAMAQLVAKRAAASVSGARVQATEDVITDAGWPATSTVRVQGHCATDRTAAECVRCLKDSARAVDWELYADRDGGVAAAVLGFNCYLAFDVSTVPRQTETWGFFNVSLAIVLGGFVAAYALLIAYSLCCALLSGKEGKTDNEKKMKDAAAAGPPLAG